MIMISKDKRNAPFIANISYIVDLIDQLIIRFAQAAVLYPIGPGFAGNSNLLQMTAVWQVLCKIMKFRNVFFHDISRKSPKVRKVRKILFSYFIKPVFIKQPNL